MRPKIWTKTLAALLCAGVVPFALGLSAAGCGGSSTGGVGNVTNSIVVSPVDGSVLGFAIQDRFYRQTVTVTGGGQAPFRFGNLNNSLPPGLFLLTTGADGGAVGSASQVDLVGFPRDAGPTQATFQILDANNDRTDPFFSLTVNPRPATGTLNVLPASGTVLVTAQVGTAYVTTLTVGNGAAPYTWRVVYGGLPPGLTLTPNPSGTDSAVAGISGTPTQDGTWFVGVEVDDQNNPQRSSGGIFQVNVVR